MLTGGLIAQMEVLESNEPGIVLFAAIKAIYRYATDHGIAQVTLATSLDLIREFPALGLVSAPGSRQGRRAFIMRPRELQRNFLRFPRHPMLYYLMAMLHPNIGYR